MAGAGEVLEKSRQLFDEMGERNQKVVQAGHEIEHSYERLTAKIQKAESAVEELRLGALGAQGELKSAMSQLFWLVVLTTFASGMLGALVVRFLT